VSWLAAFRDPALASSLVQRIRGIGPQLPEGGVTLMEVCGTHTVAIARNGIRDLLPQRVRLVSGPGCPVCVTPVGYTDHALALARLPAVVLASFGDMLRVPGSSGSLAAEVARGAQVEVVTSTLDALALARAHPDRQVVFLAVGFETTAPTVAAAVLAARQEGLDNFSILCAHKTVPRALQHLAARPDFSVHGLICPGHVSAIIGTRPYESLARRGVPCVVGGFEALDILATVARLLELLARGESRVENTYRRVVREEGNSRARAISEQVFEPCDAGWRGLGQIPGSGLALRPELSDFDAARRFEVELEPPREPPGCICGEVLCGTAEPADCPLFGETCTPESPAGACMVSGEGTCAAHFRYGGAG
jgi:hydrogenase expression/formation protein HypD